MREGVVKCQANHVHHHGANGSHQCYMLGKCRCVRCVRSHAQYLRVRRRLAGADSRVSALGAQRRIHGLALFGWSQRRIAEMAGLPLVRVNAISSGHAQVIALSTHRKVADVARRLDGVRAPVTSGSVRCVNRAKKLGWVALAAWDDIDRDVVPPSTDDVPAARTIDYVAVERLWREGLSDSQIGERLGCSGSGVQRARKRMGLETKWAA